MLLDEGGPNAIRFHPLCMVSSIEFNHQTTFNTTKVGDEWTDSHVVDETSLYKVGVHAILPRLCPQHPFGCFEADEL